MLDNPAFTAHIFNTWENGSSQIHDPSLTFRGGGFGPVGPFIGGSLEPRADLMSPLRLQWAREKDLDYFQMVLGAVETGTVGYMAYRHVQKYGLFR